MTDYQARLTRFLGNHTHAQALAYAEARGWDTERDPGGKWRVCRTDRDSDGVICCDWGCQTQRLAIAHAVAVGFGERAGA